MHKFLEIALTGVAAILLHPKRSAVTTGCLLAILSPYLTGLGISEGIRIQAEDSIRFGSDLYVTGKQFGRNVPIPLYAMDAIGRIEGVRAVVPRIVGQVFLGRDRVPAVVVGMDPNQLGGSIKCVDGKLFSTDGTNEFVIGTELARRLSLHVGSVIPPFYHSSKGDRSSKVVGVFHSDVSLWQANLVFTAFRTAAAIFDQEQLATDLLVYCRPGYETEVSLAILRIGSFSATGSPRIQPRVIARPDLIALLSSGPLHRAGIFNLHFLLAFAVGIPLVLVSSGIGLAEQRREIGILKALGWQTDEVLWRSMIESLVLSVLSASLAVIIAFAWLRWFNGFGVASIFLTSLDRIPSVIVPFRLTPVPTLLCFLVSFVIASSGTLVSTWRSAIASPAEAMR